MKRLIINSDDYGRTPEISRGIRETHTRGVVTSTTCMMNIPTTAADIAVALKETPTLGMGVHLVLTMGDPISDPGTVPSMTDKNGHFFKYAALVERLPQLSLEEVKAEKGRLEISVKAKAGLSYRIQFWVAIKINCRYQGICCQHSLVIDEEVLFSLLSFLMAASRPFHSHLPEKDSSEERRR